MIREALPNRRLQRVVFRCLTVVDVVTARCAQRWIRPGACLAIDRQTEEALLDELSAVDADVANFRHQCPSQPTLEVDHRCTEYGFCRFGSSREKKKGCPLAAASRSTMTRRLSL